jgi:hypothetical protein
LLSSKTIREIKIIKKQFLSLDEPCVLYCLSNANSFAKLEPRVKDGTKCKLGTRNMCISGVCRVRRLYLSLGICKIVPIRKLVATLSWIRTPSRIFAEFATATGPNAK